MEWDRAEEVMQEKRFYRIGNGKDTHEAIQMMQTKMSREIFRGHQRVILIGEKWLKVVLLQF